MSRLLLIFFILQVSLLSAQDTLRLKVTAADRDTFFINNTYKYKSVLPNEKSIEIEIDKTLNALYAEGYIHAYVADTVHIKKIRWFKLVIGKPIKWGKISMNPGEEALLSKAGSRISGLQNKPIGFDELKTNIDRLLTYYENNGYPFARVQLDSLDDENDHVTAHLHIEKNKLILIDSINIVGVAKISRQYLYNYINVKPGMLYDEEVIANISARLRELPFLEETRPSAITFFTNKAILNLFVRTKNADKFDMLIALLPNTTTSPTQSKLTVTGDGEIDLINAISRGESMTLYFEKLQAQTTQVKATITYPYIFSLPFGVTGGFDLFLQDTLYRNIDYNIGIEYLLKGSDYIKGYYKVFQSRLLTIDTATIIATEQLPSTLDMTTNQYGIEYNVNHTDFRFNPRKGYTLYLNGSVGTRTIDENTQIVNLKDPNNPTFDFHTLYDSLKLKTNEYHLQVTAACYFPLSGSNVIKLQYANQYIIGDNVLPNELLMIGGENSIRGFDEQSISAKWQNTATVEYRYLLGPFSYVNVFTDLAYIDEYNGTSYLLDYPIGIGAGLTLQTRAGIFAMSYAFGKMSGEDFQFKNGKIHFGYINVF